MNIRQVIYSDIEKSIKKSGFEASSPVVVAYPTDPKFGDYSTNWPLQAAKELQQSPMEVAKKLQSGLEKIDLYATELAAPGFINFHLRPEFLAKHLKLVVAEGEKFGLSTSGKGKTVLVEYSSPNIAKPMHVGHLRNTNLGQAIVNLLTYNSYQTITDNHIGDWGTQFGKLIYAYKTWGKGLANPSISDLLKLYIKFHDEAKDNQDLEKSAREEFKKLESGDQENRHLWERFRQISLQEFDRLYRELGAKFDYQHGESFYEKELPKVVEAALKSGAAKKDPDGSVIIPLEGMPPFLILKSDGATLYGTRDLATARYRVEKFSPNAVLYVIAAEQTLYLRQLFTALKKLGWGSHTKWMHVSYGLTRLPQGKLSTRSGDLVTAEEILREAEKRAEKVISEKDKSGKADTKLVKAVAIGALKWNDLRLVRDSEVTFDWDQIFNFEGNSGPYIQYSFARTQNILAKAGKEFSFDESRLTSKEEQAILRQLVKFPEIIEQAADSCSPHLICQFAFEIAQNFSRFYETSPVLTSPAGQREARLALVAAVGNVLRISLTLLGIESPARL